MQLAENNLGGEGRGGGHSVPLYRNMVNFFRT